MTVTLPAPWGLGKMAEAQSGYQQGVRSPAGASSFQQPVFWRLQSDWPACFPVRPGRTGRRPSDSPETEVSVRQWWFGSR